MPPGLGTQFSAEEEKADLSGSKRSLALWNMKTRGLTVVGWGWGLQSYSQAPLLLFIKPNNICLEPPAATLLVLGQTREHQTQHGHGQYSLYHHRQRPGVCVCVSMGMRVDRSQSDRTHVIHSGGKEGK